MNDMTKPKVKREPRTDTRRTILDSAIQTVLEKGYHQCGLTEILNRADVPKGSFYYYFASKEEFGLQLIDHWLENFAEAEESLADKSSSPLERVRGYFEARARLLKRFAKEFGTVVGTLHLEMASHNETFRCRVENLLTRWQRDIAACLNEAQQNGEIATDRDANILAEFCLISWEGAVQRARTLQSPAPVDLFFEIIFGSFLTKQQPDAPAPKRTKQ
jgi:TetR/AcrR family transcriptional regulator, transcriptional repressor for nem operon